MESEHEELIDLLVSVLGIITVISFAFRGIWGKDNAEIIKMRNDVLYGDIPDISQDKKNLKSDNSNIAKDLNKAFSDYKLYNAS